MAKITVKTRKHKTHRMSPASLKNLEGHQFEKGNNANPAGRPVKALSITESLRAVAELPVDGKVDFHTMTFAQAAAYVHWQKAVKGNQEAYEFITERLEGKLPNVSAVDLTTKGKGLNEQPSIPTTVIDQAMAILYASGCDTPPPGDSGAAKTE